MKNSHSLKQRVRNNEQMTGCWVEMFNPVATEIMAMCGYDTAFIDLEHGPGSYLDAISMMQAMGRYPCEPIIRVTSNDEAEINFVQTRMNE